MLEAIPWDAMNYLSMWTKRVRLGFMRLRRLLTREPLDKASRLKSHFCNRIAQT